MIGDFIPMREGSRVGHCLDTVTGCWLWVGAKSRGGYGRVGVPGQRRTAQAHRMYFEREHGPVAAGLDLDHLCRNRGCVNPSHLEPVPRRVNARRGRGTKLTPLLVQEIRALVLTTPMTFSALGRKYGVHAKTISDAITLENWRTT